MRCADLDGAILEYAAGIADEADARDVRAHVLRGCPRCIGRLAEAKAVAAEIPLSLEPVSPRAEVRERLMARIQPPTKIVPFPAPERGRGWVRPALAAAVAAGVVGAAVWIPLRQERAQLRLQLAGAEEALRTMRSPRVAVVSLGGGEKQPNAVGRIFWDRVRNQWWFYASELAPPDPGRTYELWFINDKGDKVPAGTFDVDASGSGQLMVSVPDGIGTITLAAVTDEPRGGSPQPTGQIHLVGKVANPS